MQRKHGKPLLTPDTVACMSPTSCGAISVSTAQQNQAPWAASSPQGHCSRCRFETSRQQEVCCTQNRLPVFHGDVGSFLSGASRFTTVLTDRAITIASNGNPQPVELRVAFRDSAPKHKCFSSEKHCSCLQQTHVVIQVIFG